MIYEISFHDFRRLLSLSPDGFSVFPKDIDLFTHTSVPRRSFMLPTVAGGCGNVSVKASTTRPNYQIRAVDRALDVLEAFTDQQPFLSLDEICERVGLPKSTVFKILAVLERRLFVERSETDDAYRIGFQAFAAGNRYLSGVNVLQTVRPYLKHLATKMPKSQAHIAVLSPTETKVVYLDSYSVDTMVAMAPVGAQNFAHSSALGKSLLAWLAEEELERRLQTIELPKFTVHTICDTQQLREHLRRVRAQGYSLDDEERQLGNLCVAVPIRDRRGVAVAAVSTAHVKDVLAEDLATVIDYMVAVGEEVSRLLGYVAPEPEYNQGNRM